MLDEEAVAVEQLREGHFSRRTIKNVVLFYFDPRQSSSVGVQFVNQPSHFLFLGHKVFAGLEPFGSRDDFRIFHLRFLQRSVHFVFQK